MNNKKHHTCKVCKVAFSDKNLNIYVVHNDDHTKYKEYGICDNCRIDYDEYLLIDDDMYIEDNQ